MSSESQVGTTRPTEHEIVWARMVSGNLWVCLEDSGNIVVRRKTLRSGDVDVTVTNISALINGLSMAAAERGIREAREVLDR
jgi:hypothetical protein